LSGLPRSERDADFRPDEVDLVGLDRAFLEALRSGRPDHLPVVGHGEISVAFSWPPAHPTVVAKSLPPFADVERFAAYADLLDEYLATLSKRGVEPLPTAVRAIADGPRRRAYVLQPSIPSDAVVSAVLARSGPAEGESLLARIVDAVLLAADATVGIDAQVSNWVVPDGHLRFLDVSTPMLRDAAGRDRLDTALFVEEVPWLLRGPVNRFVAPELLSPYHDPRRVVLDAAGNLVREGLSGWVPTLLRIANPHLDRALTMDEVHRFYRANVRLWSTLQRLRRLGRWWQQRIRRRPYPFLLPDSHYR
jgi:hypothetical protein